MVILRLLANGMALFTLVGTILAWLYPAPFLGIKPYFLFFFAATMFALGIVLEPVELRSTLRQPKSIALGVLAQFLIMPTLGFLVAHYGGLSPQLAVGFIIVACAPGAMASNVIVYLAGGALAYSIALTTVATFLSPLLTPSLVQILGGVFVPIPFWQMMQTIVLTVVLPLTLGMVLRPRLGRGLKFATELAPAVASLAIVIICSYAVAANADRIALAGPSIFGFVIGLNAKGYGLGWIRVRLFGIDRRHRITLSIEIGMQNAGLGVALALKHFEPETALPGALFAVWCILTAAGATGYVRMTGAKRSVTCVTADLEVSTQA